MLCKIQVYLWNFSVFTTAQYCRPKMQVSQYRQIRNLKKSQVSFKPEYPFPNANIETGTIPPAKLWKHLGFTIMVNK